MDWGKVLQGDRFFALLHIRALTYGPEYAFSVTCQNEGCRSRIDWELDLRELPVRALSDESRAAFLDGNRFPTMLPDAGKRVWFRLLTGADERRLPALRRGAGDRVLSAMLAFRVSEVEGVEARDLRKFLEDLTLRDADFLVDEFDRVDCGVDITVYQVAYRIGRIWEGFKAGFTSTIEEARPVFRDLVQAFSALGREVAAIFTAFTGGAAMLPSAGFRSFGEVAGAAISTVVTLLARAVAILARYWGSIARGLGSMVQYIRPALQVVREAVGELLAAWSKLAGGTLDAGAAADTSAGPWRSLGEVIGRVLGGAVTVVTLALGGLIKVVSLVMSAVNLVKDLFVGAGTVIGETAARIYLWFTESLPAAAASAFFASAPSQANHQITDFPPWSIPPTKADADVARSLVPCLDEPVRSPETGFGPRCRLSPDI